jgi:endonuclease/exonuclease/phosphatase family metal-dependent hydrolase
MSANLFRGAADPDAVVALARRHDVDVLSLQELTPEALARLDAAGLQELLPGRAVGLGNGVLARAPVTLLEVAGPKRLTAQVGDGLRIEAVHPVPPHRASLVPIWTKQLRSLPAARPDAHVMAGDLNATLDHRALRAVLDRGWTDAAGAVGAGLQPTWPVGRPAPKVAIDHVLAGPGVGVRGFSVHDVPGSDHRAVIAELVLPGQR